MATATRDARFWDRTARKYATDPIADMPGYERSRQRTRELLSATDHVLEIGCGTGTTALSLAPSVARIVATDVSSEMIAIAREKAADARCANIDFHVAPAEATPAHPGGFDAVLAFNVLHLVPDRAAVFARVRERLKPGGLFISKTTCLSEMNPLIRLAVPVARLVGKAPQVAFFKASELEADLTIAGFTITERARHGSGKRDPRIFIVANAP